MPLNEVIDQKINEKFLKAVITEEITFSEQSFDDFSGRWKEKTIRKVHSKVFCGGVHWSIQPSPDGALESSQEVKKTTTGAGAEIYKNHTSQPVAFFPFCFPSLLPNTASFQ